LDDHERHQGALKPVRAVREEPHDGALRLGDDEVVALHVRLDERARPLLAEDEGGEIGAGLGVGETRQSDLDHGGAGGTATVAIALAAAALSTSPGESAGRAPSACRS